MTNPILSMLNGANSIRSAQQNNGFPTSIDDPRMDEAKKYVQEHGGNPKQAFYQLCKEKMLNPAAIINMFMGRQ